MQTKDYIKTICLTLDLLVGGAAYDNYSTVTSAAVCYKQSVATLSSSVRKPIDKALVHKGGNWI